MSFDAREGAARGSQKAVLYVGRRPRHNSPESPPPSPADLIARVTAPTLTPIIIII